MGARGCERSAAAPAVLQRDADERTGSFNARPFFRMCVGCIAELSPRDPGSSSGFGVLSALGAAFHALQPLQVPGFAFAWLELISHKWVSQSAQCESIW
jgi:CCR4-NOT transcription complex subunit 1